MGRNGKQPNPKRCRATALQKTKQPKRWRATALQKTKQPKRWRATALQKKGSADLRGDGKHLEIIEDAKLIDLETIDRFYLRGRGRALEPGCRAPTILVRHRHQPVLDRILMNVVETGKVGAFVGQTCFPTVVPHLPIGRAVQLVDGLGGGAVKLSEKLVQGRGTRLGVAHEVV